jgi:hypothetical protein
MTGEITIHVRRDACGEVCWASLEISRTRDDAPRVCASRSTSLARALPSLARGLPSLAKNLARSSQDLAKQFLHREGIGN